MRSLRVFERTPCQGQSLPVFFFVVASSLLHLVTAAPSLLDPITFAGNIGTVVNDARNVRSSFDQSRYEPYELESEPNTSGANGARRCSFGYLYPFRRSYRW